MEIKLLPHKKLVEWKDAIVLYKIIFNTGHFYIGATKNFKCRYINHKTSARHTKSCLYKKAQLLGSTECELSVLRIYGGGKSRQRAIVRCFRDELLLIQQNKTNPLFINTALNNKVSLCY